MSSRTFDRDTILDLTVNIIPLGILAFFIVAFVVFTPDPLAFDSVFSTLQFSILVTMFVLLAILTYYAGKAVAGAEKDHGIHAQTATFDPETESSLTGSETIHEATAQLESGADDETDDGS